MNNITFTMVKPDAFAEGHGAAILANIEDAGYKIIAMKMKKLSLEEAEKFYAVHSERPFYGELTQYMSGGPIIAAVLQKENAVSEYRNLIGATNPAEATEGTIRKKFGKNIGSNAVHGSDSDENAQIEASFFFPSCDIYASI
ncbi:MAG: nucleoside-diphosphate kinase [Bacteroidota bacterium]|nr:nucleoside-diphosphate kinase [Bacteroidota bacterium]